MKNLKLYLLFNTYTKLNKNTVIIDDEKYFMTDKLRKILFFRNILGFTIIGSLIFLSKFIIEPKLSHIIGKTGTLLMFLLLNFIFLYIMSYLIIPNDLGNNLTKIEK